MRKLLLSFTLALVVLGSTLLVGVVVLRAAGVRLLKPLLALHRLPYHRARKYFRRLF